MKKLLTVVMTPIVGVVGFGLYHILAGSLERRFFIENFLSLPGVESVGRYYNHEGYRSADLFLKNKGRVVVGEFDKSIFSETDDINLQRIGDIKIVCRDDSGEGGAFVLNAFNLVAYAKTTFPEVQIRNISQTIMHYDRLLASLERDLFRVDGLPIATFVEEAGLVSVTCGGRYVD